MKVVPVGLSFYDLHTLSDLFQNYEYAHPRMGVGDSNASPARQTLAKLSCFCHTSSMPLREAIRRNGGWRRHFSMTFIVQSSDADIFDYLSETPLTVMFRECAGLVSGTLDEWVTAQQMCEDKRVFQEVKKHLTKIGIGDILNVQ